jgi:hypothetical protein
MTANKRPGLGGAPRYERARSIRQPQRRRLALHSYARFREASSAPLNAGGTKSAWCATDGLTGALATRSRWNSRKALAPPDARVRDLSDVTAQSNHRSARSSAISAAVSAVSRGGRAYTAAAFSSLSYCWPAFVVQLKQGSWRRYRYMRRHRLELQLP